MYICIYSNIHTYVCIYVYILALLLLTPAVELLGGADGVVGGKTAASAGLATSPPDGPSAVMCRIDIF